MNSNSKITNQNKKFQKSEKSKNSENQNTNSIDHQKENNNLQSKQTKNQNLQNINDIAEFQEGEMGNSGNVLAGGGGKVRADADKEQENIRLNENVTQNVSEVQVSVGQLVKNPSNKQDTKIETKAEIKTKTKKVQDQNVQPSSGSSSNSSDNVDKVDKIKIQAPATSNNANNSIDSSRKGTTTSRVLNKNEKSENQKLIKLEESQKEFSKKTTSTSSQQTQKDNESKEKAITRENGNKNEQIVKGDKVQTQLGHVNSDIPTSTSPKTNIKEHQKINIVNKPITTQETQNRENQEGFSTKINTKNIIEIEEDPSISSIDVDSIFVGWVYFLKKILKYFVEIFFNHFASI